MTLYVLYTAEIRTLVLEDHSQNGVQVRIDNLCYVQRLFRIRRAVCLAISTLYLIIALFLRDGSIYSTVCPT